ncbi:MAG: DUF305 domain-containing protein [Gordonia sp. (in: high G+C Gram-positive bacteria)]|uniref:DUF305 domain-containing protein n=1 Tax=Gordonia sp. (in: high G+C Gram-positive bacteria) TaxID=84139 RepID=UPI0039E291B1
MANDATTPAESTSDDDPRADGRPRWLTTALVAIAALLIGAGLGLAFGNRGDSGAGHDHHAGAGPTAIGFSQDMIVHHEQAVEMTKIVIANGVDPKVRELAVGMLSDQGAEIGQMTGWLQSWGAPLKNPGAPMSWMNHGDDHCADGHVDEHCPATGDAHAGHGDHGHEGHGQQGHDHGGAPTSAAAPAGDQPIMAGMATGAEMDKFRSLRGAASDTYFLQLMLRHHEGGHHMTGMAIDPKNGAPEYVRALAEQMNQAQTGEEATMKQLLAERGAKPLG